MAKTYPITVSVPILLDLTDHTGILVPGDSVWIDPADCQLIQRPTPLGTFELVFDKCKVKPVATTEQNWLGHSPVTLAKTLAIITEIKRARGSDGTPVLKIYNLPIPVRLSRLQIEGDLQKALQLRPGDLAWAHTFPMPQGSRVSHSYWLPNQFSETENSAGETYVHQGDYVALFEYCDLDREQLRLPISYIDHLQNAELITKLTTKI